MEKQACTTAIHAKDGNNHCVTLSALRVMLLEDSSGWFAQGLEIDYAASGATIDEVKKKLIEILTGMSGGTDIQARTAEQTN